MEDVAYKTPCGGAGRLRNGEPSSVRSCVPTEYTRTEERVRQRLPTVRHWGEVTLQWRKENKERWVGYDQEERHPPSGERGTMKHVGHVGRMTRTA